VPYGAIRQRVTPPVVPNRGGTVLHISVLVGNPKPESRTRAVAEALAAAIAEPFGTTAVRSIDLATVSDLLFTWPSDIVDELTTAVASADLTVVASPTYKATYTGMLKAFLDRYPGNALASVLAVPVMTGASDLHGLAVETALRSLLVELGASIPTRGMYFVTNDMSQLDEHVASWVRQNGPSLRQILALRDASTRYSAPDQET
jgi:FMN reductase